MVWTRRLQNHHAGNGRKARRIKEWAYAGLAFDLIGAVYSGMSVGPVDVKMAFMLIFIIPGIVSYIYFHKKLQASIQ